MIFIDTQNQWVIKYLEVDNGSRESQIIAIDEIMRHTDNQDNLELIKETLHQWWNY